MSAERPQSGATTSAAERPQSGATASDTPTSWRTTLPCTREEAEAIDAAELTIDAVLMTTELYEDDREHWRLDAYTGREPDAATIAALRALVPSADGVVPSIEPLPAEDWVALSQAGLEPIVAGRFVVHTGAHPVAPPSGGRAFRIDAGRAFGTGHHATTAGCLAMLDGLADRSFERVIDIGTGTGLLAFAAAHLWPDAQVVATDIDPVSIGIVRENMGVNGIAGLDLIVADGALSDAIVAGAPYDLLVANILAGPLVSMAPEIAAIAAPDATIVLAGLLDTQSAQVEAAFAACGCSTEDRDRRGDWTILRLRGGAERYAPSAPFDPAGREGWALDL